MPREADVTILGGLPVTVQFTLGRAEPDIGIMSDYIDDWWVQYVKGKRISDSFSRALNKRIIDTKGEEALCEELIDQARNNYND